MLVRRRNVRLFDNRMTTLSSAAYRVGGEQGSESMPTAAAAAHRTLPPPYMMRHRLPPGWDIRESTSRPGKFYYFNVHTQQGQWEFPSAEMLPPSSSGSSSQSSARSFSEKEEFFWLPPA
ncbi:hypothetical protein FOZ63_015049 [Perkinsus olseni]|uniref:WW domain-containing protein n=1 Tax=Perkinsus olseni TaxID=32597 RepID=A0A7J6SXL9_PEROL|nr:hypothetical protein FOZ63_015049 [Perkinsus olseni]